MYLRPVVLSIFAIFSLSQIRSVAACSAPSDPDDFFDKLGAACQDYQEALPEETRADLSSGKAFFSIGTADDVVRSVVAQTDGKIFATGRTASGTTNQFLAIRFDIDGSFDPSFNTNGMVVVTIGTQDAIGHRAALQSDGKVFVAGRSAVSQNVMNYLAVRYLTSGNLDTAFGTQGYTRIAVGTSSDVARGLELDTLGNSYLGGYSWLQSQFRYVASVARLSSNGSLDTAFATSGKLILDILTAPLGILATDLDSSGRLVFAGTGFSPDWQMVAGRLSTNGTLDTSFQTQGWVLISLGTANDQLYEARVYTDKIVLAGAYHNGTNMDVAVVRLNSDGSFDTAFATTGKLGRSFSTGDDYFHHFQLDAMGGLAAAGYGVRADQDFLMARFTSNGSLDTSFYTVGFQFDSLSTSHEQATNIYLTSSGQMYPVGRIIRSGSDSDIGMLRYSPSGAAALSGTLDATFGTNGFSQIEGGSASAGDVAQGIAFQADGRIVIAGYISFLDDYLKGARLLPNGSLDTSFGTNSTGRVSSNPPAHPIWVEIDTVGKITEYGATNTSYAWRFTSNGILDTSFATIGYISLGNIGEMVHGILGSNDRSYVVNQPFGGNYISQIRRLTSNGALDTSFYTTGIRNFTGPFYSKLWTIHEDDQGRVVVGGEDEGPYPTVARFVSNGALDTSFQTVGWRHFNFVHPRRGFIGGTATGSGGKIWLSTFLTSAGGEHMARALRLTSNGSLDTSFLTVGYSDVSSGTGYPTWKWSYLILQSNEKVLVDGNRANHANYFRLNTNGTLDTTFNTTGILQKSYTSYGGFKLRASRDGRVCGLNAAGPDFGIVCFWP